MRKISFEINFFFRNFSKKFRSFPYQYKVSYIHYIILGLSVLVREITLVLDSCFMINFENFLTIKWTPFQLVYSLTSFSKSFFEFSKICKNFSLKSILLSMLYFFSFIPKTPEKCIELFFWLWLKLSHSLSVWLDCLFGSKILNPCKLLKTPSTSLKN